jgi:ferredoxin
MKIEVDEEICLGCGLCVALCPEVFEMDKNGHSKVKENALIDKEKLKEVIDECPAQAIYVEDLIKKKIAGKK